MRYIFIASAFAFSVVATQLPAAQEPKGDKKTELSFPTKIGTTWEYKTGTTISKQRIVEAKEEKDGSTVVKINEVGESASKKEGYLVGVFRVTQSGVFVSQTGLMMFDPPFQEFKFPLKDGMKWEFSAGYFKKTPYEGTIEVSGPDKIEVPAGRYMAFRLVMTMKDEKKPLNTKWFVPNVGVVKSISQDGRQVTELQSFTVPKD